MNSTFDWLVESCRSNLNISMFIEELGKWFSDND